MAETRDEYVRYQGNALVLKLARFVWQMHVLSAILLVYVLKDAFGPAMLWSWAIWMIILGVAQGIISFRGAAAANAGKPIGRYARVFDASAILLALGWGWLGFVLVPVDDIELRTFVGFIISGGVLTGTGTHNMRYPMLVTTLTIIMGAMAARAVLDNQGGQGVVSGLMLLLFLGLMLGLGWVLRGFTRRGFALQWDKMQLADQLEIARSDAEEANLAKSRFLAQASHDLRQPIHAMGLLLASLPDEPRSGPAEMVIGRLRQSVDVLSKLFTSLLDVTLLDTQQIAPAPQPIDLPALVDEVAAEFRAAAEASGCTLRAESAASHIETDPLIMRRILQNLVSNAIRHGEGTDILITTRIDEAAAFLTVQDWGPGISKSDQARMFEAFQRGTSVTDATEGVGLGLAIVQRLAALVGASVSVSSDEGAGAAFTVGPFAIVERAEAVPAPAPVATGADVSGRVLIIDDDRATLEATGALLSGWGWDVDPTSSLTPEKITGIEKPDLVLSDYDLGRGRSGLDVVKDVRSAFGEVPALIMTGSSSPETRARIEAEGLLVLLKPVRPAQLRSAMISLMG